MSDGLVSNLLIGAGVLEILMRIFNGWFADRKLISSYNQLAISMAITGVCALLCAVISGTAGRRK